MCICAFRKGPVNSLPASVKFWLHNFHFFAATVAAANGWIYFACVVVRKLTKTTTIWAPFIHSFTYFVSSDKQFLWSIFCTRSQSRIYHVACGVQNISWLVRPHRYFSPACWERDIVIHCIWYRGQLWYQQRHALSQTSKQLVAQAFPCDSPAYALTGLEWGSLIVQTWGQYLKYFFLTSLWKSGTAVLWPDSWRDRSRSCSTPHGVEVLDMSQG
jgi:hypothetical protein